MASRTRAIGACCSARFWFSACCAALMPTSLGYHDVAALLVRQPVVPHGWGGHLIASPFGTIEPATFTYARPIGTTMPRPPGYQLINFDPDSIDADASAFQEQITARSESDIVYPTVNRQMKGDRLPSSNTAPAPAQPASLPPLQPIDATPAPHPVQPPAPPASPVAPRPVHAEVPTAAYVPTEVPAAGDIDPRGGQAPALASLAFVNDDAEDRGTQIYFGAAVTGSPSGIESWAPGAAPIVVTTSSESGIKLTALEGAGDDGLGGESVAGKDDAARTQSPAQRLGLAGAERAQAEKCLTDAVYFEARGEPLRGQEAVAQVVMNRVFSGYYPRNVCGVVFQNASHYLACQFTFACEHRNLSRIDEPDMWEQAKRIAKDELDGKIWLADIGHATHYHAYWVHPSWVHEMMRLYKLGVHTFYRPRAWGNGDDEPVWGPAPNTSKADGIDVRQQASAASPKPAAGRT
jgi:hypothetical protein